MNGKDLLMGLGNISPKYYDEAENDTITEVRTHRTFRRPLLVAAIIALTALLVGCGVMVVWRMLNWTPEMEEYLTSYNEETGPGAVARDWYIEDVDISLSIDQPETSILPISVVTWAPDDLGTLEVGTEYWIDMRLTGCSMESGMRISPASFFARIHFSIPSSFRRSHVSVSVSICIR